MPEIKPFQIHLLRAFYLLVAVGNALTAIPAVLFPDGSQANPHTVIQSMLAAFALLAVLGLRYPLRMLPLLLFELLWKLIWVFNFALRMWLDEGLDAYAVGVLFACMIGLVLTPLVIPWRYVAYYYARSAGDPWRGGLKTQIN